MVYQYGQLHGEDDPAVKGLINGYEEFWLNGIRQEKLKIGLINTLRNKFFTSKEKTLKNN